MQPWLNKHHLFMSRIVVVHTNIKYATLACFNTMCIESCIPIVPIMLLVSLPSMLLPSVLTAAPADARLHHAAGGGAPYSAPKQRHMDASHQR